MSQPQTHADLANDLPRLDAQMHAGLPDWVCKDPALTVELFSSVLPQQGRVTGGTDLYDDDEICPLIDVHFRRIPEPAPRRMKWLPSPGIPSVRWTCFP